MLDLGHSFPRRVLMTTDTIGGVWTYALDLSRGLLANGVEVMLATMGAPVQPRQREAVEDLGRGIQLFETRFKLEWMEDPWRDVAAAGEWLLALERDYQPDMIHLNGYAHAALPWKAPTVVVAHSCVFSWWHAVKKSAPPAGWRRYHEAVCQGLQHAGLVIAPSRAMLAQIARHYGLPANARVIYNGCDAGNRPAVEKEPFILSVGRMWDEAKNAASLATIAPRLSWPVRVAGETRRPDGGEVVLPKVELLGFRSPVELQEDYARAAIYALPARYEPFGLSILEAALAGCALVLGDIASLREIWGSTALFVSPDDPDALYEAITDLIANPARREALADASRRRAQSFSTERMTSAYLSAYEALLAASKPVETTTHAHTFA
ncbi:MAG: glycosyl transferase family 1 [Rariglobus sp.]|jgi:glycosyltransferase involved in cell wall biosynthesis|nr:glycosyl transferase family 1 [Rariglobus sp.]